MATLDSNAEARSARAQRVLAALRDRRQATLAELTKLAGMSRPTATTIVGELEALGLVAQIGVGTGAGRPAALYAFAPKHGVVMGLDIQRDVLAITAASFAGELLLCETVELHPGSGEQRLDEVARHAGAVAEKLSSVHGEVICGFASTTGIVDGDGVVLRSYLVPQWQGVALADELSSRLGFPLRVDNDVNTATYGEFATRVSAGRLGSDDTLLHIRLFAGFRTGLILGGDIHRGHHWHAGEVNDSLNTELRARFDATGDMSDWPLRAATTIGAISAVVDPAVVVLYTSKDPSGVTADALSEHLEAMRLPTAPALNIEGAELGQAAASVGAISLALRDAEKHFLQAQTPYPIAPAGVEQIVARHEASDMVHATPARLAVDVSEPLRIGIAGVGMRSQLARHAESPGNDAVIAVACDPDPNAVHRVHELLGKDPETFPVVGSVRQLIEFGVGAVFVTSPDDTHMGIATELLSAGIPVYLEKPIATSIEASTRVLTTAFTSGTKLYVGHNMRHMSFVRQMRELIQEGRIGEVKTIWCRHFVGNGGDYYFKDWHADRSHSSGLLLQKGAHDIDVMHWLANSRAESVVGMGDLMVYGDVTNRGGQGEKLMSDWFSLDNWPPHELTGLNPVVDVEDVSMLMLRMRSGVLASYQQCHFSPDYWRNYTIIGTHGRLENHGDGDGGVIRLWNRRSNYNPDGDEQFPILGDKDGHGEADALTVAEFLRFVRTGAPTDTSPLGAWYAVAAGIQATESLRDGSRPREIPALPVDLVAYFENNQESPAGQSA